MFPKTPSQLFINDAWEKFWELILDIVDRNRRTPTPTLAAAGYLSRSSEDIASGRVAHAELSDTIKNLEKYLSRPHAQQALLSAVICRWVFQSPEPICKDHHPKPLMKLLALLEAKCTHQANQTHGTTTDKKTSEEPLSSLNQIQHADKLVAQEMFADPDEQTTTIHTRQQNLLTNIAAVTDTLNLPHTPPIRTALKAFAAEAIALKHALMLSPHDYRIHYAHPETGFDARWMAPWDAENLQLSDAEAAGKNVAVCLVPALLALPAMPFADDAGVEEVLVKNEGFFPNAGEVGTLDLKQCVVKAVVLVL